MIHVAVLHSRYLDAILAGEKTVESRISRVRCDPFGSVHAGERVYFKASGAAILATAIVGRVESFEELTPARVSSLRKRFNALVRADAEYWRDKRAARFATFMFLENVAAVRFGPRFPAFYGRAWQRLPDTTDVYPRCLSERRVISA